MQGSSSGGGFGGVIKALIGAAADTATAATRAMASAPPAPTPGRRRPKVGCTPCAAKAAVRAAKEAAKRGTL